MRMLSEGQLARSIAYLLIGTFAWSAGFMGLAVGPAAAQIVTRAATTQSVAVIPFENRSSFRPETFGDEAASAVTVELRDRLLLDVLPKADVVLQMRNLGLQVPLSDAELVRLATEMDVSLLVAGEVRGARIESGPDGPYGEVALAVRLFSRVAKVNVNGALVVGKGPSSPDASHEVLLEKALQQAAFMVVEEMKSRPAINAMVLWTRGDVIFLNVGSRGGIRAGMYLVAVRGGERIALAEVDEADAIGSYAHVVQGPPLRTGDQLTAVYTLPAQPGRERVGMTPEKKKSFESVVLLGAILLGFGQYASRARRIEEGDVTAPNFRASSLANGAELGYSGYWPSFHPLRDYQPHPAALITWESYQSTERSRLIGYEIRRSMGQIVDVLVFDFTGDPNMLVDFPQAPSHFELFVEISDLDGGIASYEPLLELWAPTEINEETGELDNPTWADFVDGYSGEIGIEVTSTSVTYRWFPSMPQGDDYGGMEPGWFYQYVVRPLIVQRIEDGSWVLNIGTEFSRTANTVVGVTPAYVSSTHWVQEGTSGPYELWSQLPNPQISATMATFFFYYPLGADEIVLQVARDPNVQFAPPNVTNVSVPPTAPIPPPGDPPTTIVQVNLSQVPGVSPLFWWRVGARNSSDTRLPRTLPIGDPYDSGFTWSVRRAFQVSAVSRAELMHKEREALSAARSAAARVPRTAATDRILRAE